MGLIDLSELTDCGKSMVSQRVKRTVEQNAGASLQPDKAIFLIFKPLEMVLCSSCDGVPLKFKRKIAGLPVHDDG